MKKANESILVLLFTLSLLITEVKAQSNGIAPNLIRNGYMNILDGSKPSPL